MGTAGARFMVAKQVAASGGLFIEEGNTRISLDPGPGAVVQYAKREIDLTTLDARSWSATGTWITAAM